MIISKPYRTLCYLLSQSYYVEKHKIINLRLIGHFQISSIENHMAKKNYQSAKINYSSQSEKKTILSNNNTKLRNYVY